MTPHHFISKNDATPQKVFPNFSTPLYIKEMMLPHFISKKNNVTLQKVFHIILAQTTVIKSRRISKVEFG